MERMGFAVIERRLSLLRVVEYEIFYSADGEFSLLCRLFRLRIYVPYPLFRAASRFGGAFELRPSPDPSLETLFGRSAAVVRTVPHRLQSSGFYARAAKRLERATEPAGWTMRVRLAAAAVTAGLINLKLPSPPSIGAAESAKLSVYARLEKGFATCSAARSIGGSRCRRRRQICARNSSLRARKHANKRPEIRLEFLGRALCAANSVCTKLVESTAYAI
ncbi:hypothetical protein MTO96_019862 [Rhipicephalus appendiculatus]